MKFIAIALAAAWGLTTPEVAPSAVEAAPLVRHCQVPCGIYGDQMRIDMLMEDADTIEKGMKSMGELAAAESPNHNQLVRWVMTKDQHAQGIQDQVAAYWLAQRIKAPGDASDAAARDAYHTKLELLHGITVSAMKCKQTEDVAHVATLRKLALDFCASYFSKEDLEHIRAHHKDH